MRVGQILCAGLDIHLIHFRKYETFNHSHSDHFTTLNLFYVLFESKIKLYTFHALYSNVNIVVREIEQLKDEKIEEN